MQKDLRKELLIQSVKVLYAGTVKLYGDLRALDREAEAQEVQAMALRLQEMANNTRK